MQKLIGSVLILLAALGYAGSSICSQRRHFHQLLLWKEYIWMIQNSMESWNRLVIPLLDELGQKAEEPFAGFFNELAYSLKNYDASDVMGQWSRLAHEKRGEFGWSPGEWETFLDGGRLFVLSDKEMIGKEGNQLSRRVDFFIEQAQADAGKREKLSIYLSTSAGIMLILLFI
ncbi:MAG: stage III sporulation protein AB [Roseburia sp.]